MKAQPASDTRVKTCEECGREYRPRGQFAGYTRRFCSSQCAGEGHRRRALATYPPREEILELCAEGLSDREIGMRYGHSYQWALNVRKAYEITAEDKTPKAKPVVRRRHSHGYWIVGGDYEHRRLMKRSKRRDWTDPRAKVDAEGKCRVCARAGIKLDAAHLIPRSRVSAGAGEHVDNIVPLCAERCHPAFDRHELDLLPFLTLGEQGKAVELSNGLLDALRRLTGKHWAPVEDAA